MRVLILGGTGFLGPHITERLTGFGHEVTVFHRGLHLAALPEGVGVIEGDRNCLDISVEAFRRLRPDIVVDVLAFTEAQAESLVTVFRGIARRVVALSSGDVYRAYDILFGRVPGDVEPTPLTEASPLRDRLYPYRGAAVPQRHGFSWDDYDKILVERVLLGNRDLPATVLRLPMIYGPGATDVTQRRFLPYLKSMSDNGASVLLDQRTARWRAPWGYARDIAEAVRLAVENDAAEGQVYNVCDPDALDIRSWVEELAAATGWKGEIVTCEEECPPLSMPRNLNLNQHLNMDSEKVRRELGYRETASRREALEKTIEWERANWPEEVQGAC